MKKYLKQILLFIIILFFWLLSGLIFKYDAAFYSMLKLPVFFLFFKLISIIWFLIYILLTNYFANQLFMYFFFYLMSPFLGFAITTIVMLSTIFLFIETKKISKTSSYFLIPYIIYGIYAFILMATVYFMNF